MGALVFVSCLVSSGPLGEDPPIDEESGLSGKNGDLFIFRSVPQFST